MFITKETCLPLPGNIILQRIVVSDNHFISWNKVTVCWAGLWIDNLDPGWLQFYWRSVGLNTCVGRAFSWPMCFLQVELAFFTWALQCQHWGRQSKTAMQKCLLSGCLDYVSPCSFGSMIKPRVTIWGDFLKVCIKDMSHVNLPSSSCLSQVVVS